jgi:type III restriction enzyme
MLGGPENLSWNTWPMPTTTPTKKVTMETYWVPGVNNLGNYGRWAFAEFTDVYQMQADFETKVEGEFNKMIESMVHGE